MVAFNFNSIKIFLIVFLAAAVIWFYKDYDYQKAENKRQSKNMQQVRMQDSMKYAALSLSKREIEDYLTYQNKTLKEALEKQNIKLKNIQRIVSQELTYKDQLKQSTSLDPVVIAIKEDRPITYPVKDSTKCLIVEGNIVYDGDSLKLDINNRVFKNKTDIVAHLERRQWKFLGIKTRFLGKKQAVIKTFNECGDSNTLIIDNKKQQ